MEFSAVKGAGRGRGWRGGASADVGKKFNDACRYHAKDWERDRRLTPLHVPSLVAAVKIRSLMCLERLG